MPVDLSAGIFLIQSRDLDSRQNGTLPGRSKFILAGRIPLSTCDGRGAGVDSACLHWAEVTRCVRQSLYGFTLFDGGCE